MFSKKKNGAALEFEGNDEELLPFHFEPASQMMLRSNGKRMSESEEEEHPFVEYYKGAKEGKTSSGGMKGKRTILGNMCLWLFNLFFKYCSVVV